MRKINIETLQRGDIVLTTSTELESRLIRIGTASDISHAMLCVSRGSVIDSTGEGVHARNIQKMFYPDSCAIHILRLKNPLEKDRIEEILNYLRSSVGTSYALGEAIVSVAKVGRGSGKQFCSRLIARAFASVGVMLVKNPDFCTPADLKRSKLMELVNDSALPVSEDDVAEIEDIGDKTVGMRGCTSSLLRMAREINPKIECINDITRTAIERPDFDEALSIALKESGYLDYWKEEIEIHPWRYDLIKIVQLYHSLRDPAELLEYCHQTLLDEQNETFRHWKVSLQALSELNAQHPRKTLQLFYSLYMELNFYHKIRIQSAKLIVKVYDKNRPSESLRTGA